VKMYCGGICSWRLSPVARRPGRAARRRGTAHSATSRCRGVLPARRNAPPYALRATPLPLPAESIPPPLLASATLIEVLRRRRPYDEGHRRLEKFLGLVYVAGWRARLWRWFPGATRVRLERHVLAVGREAGRPPLTLAFASDFHLGPTTP